MLRPEDRPQGVLLYGTRWCPYCIRARQLLAERAIPYEDVDVSGDPTARAWVARWSGQRTVPQIFIDGVPIGGFEELRALDREGALPGR